VVGAEIPDCCQFRGRSLASHHDNVHPYEAEAKRQKRGNRVKDLGETPLAHFAARLVKSIGSMKPIFLFRCARKTYALSFCSTAPMQSHGFTKVCLIERKYQDGWTSESCRCNEARRYDASSRSLACADRQERHRNAIETNASGIALSHAPSLLFG
jgi:hypothetical protein